MKKLLLSLLFLFLAGQSLAATLLPPGRQQFFGPNGQPLSGGSVYFYVPNTTVPKATWQDAGQVNQNTNPVLLDSGGFATIYGSGAYTEIVQDNAGNVIYNQLTYDTSNSQNSWAGTAGGTANAITVTTTNFTASDGQTVSFISQYQNTTATTITINGNTYGIDESSPTGPIALSGGEISAGQVVNLTYSTTFGAFLITNPQANNQVTPIAASSTTNLGSASYTNVNVTGSGVSIASFGSSANIYFPLYFVTFSGANTIVYNATSMTTPTGQNILTQSGTLVLAEYLGSGNWQILSVSNAAQQAVGAPPSARNLVINVTGNTTISVSADYAVIPNAGYVASAICPGFSATLSTTGGNGPGGVDTGTLSASSWAYVYLISNGTTCNAMLSASSTAPSLTNASGYVYYTRAGAVSLDSSSYLYRTKQWGNRAQYIITPGSPNTTYLPIVASGVAGTVNSTTTTWSAVTVANKFVPSTATQITTQIAVNGNTGCVIQISPNTSYQGYANGTATSLCAIGSYTGTSAYQSFLCQMALEAPTIQYASNCSSAPQIGAYGWVDAVAMQ